MLVVADVTAVGALDVEDYFGRVKSEPTDTGLNPDSGHVKRLDGKDVVRE